MFFVTLGLPPKFKNMTSLLHRTKALLFVLVAFLTGITVNGKNLTFSDNHNPILTNKYTVDDSIVVLVTKLLNDFPNITDEEYQKRLLEISGQIDYRLDPLVKERIIVSTEKYRQHTEHLLGKGDIYFPIFEEYLTKYNIPHHLKYLAVIESHLNPVAKSWASAVGLWQFIPSSGRVFGLQIDNNIDERSDTHKASEAAAQFLSILYDKYKDWSLAMAAYNCGPGRVDYALKLSKATDYWSVRNYLPKETQNYVPYFMAMVYVGEFHKSHDLVPEKMPQDLVLTDTIHMSGGISVIELAKQLNLNPDTLKFLNPSYRANHVLHSPKGRIIVLPARIVAELRGYDEALERVLGLQKNNPIKAVRRVKSTEDLQWLCRAHRCHMQDILLWNELPSNYVPNEGDLIAIRKNNVFNNTSAPEIIVAEKPLEPISLSYLKVTGLDSNKKNASTITVESDHKVGEIVANAKSGEQVKAAKKHRFHIRENQAVPTANATMPSANLYEKPDRKVSIEQLSSYTGNIVSSVNDTGNTIESSYSKIKYDKAEYKFDLEKESGFGAPLITPELKTELQQSVQNDQNPSTQKSNDLRNVENIITERNRNRNIRTTGTENNTQNNQPGSLNPSGTNPPR